MKQIPSDPWERLLRRRQVTAGGCWEAGLATNQQGYVQVADSTSGAKRRLFVHRLAFERTTGTKVPDGLQIDHLCRNPRCYNPDHLECVTPQENVRRAEEAVTHCKYGHPLSGDNLGKPNGHVKRVCRACRKRHSAKRYARRKAQGHYRSKPCVRNLKRHFFGKAGGSDPIVDNCIHCGIHRSEVRPWQALEAAA